MQSRLILLLLALLGLFSMPSCANLTDNLKRAGEEGARVILADALPLLKDTGESLANHAADRFKEAAKDFVSEAKDDLGASLKELPGKASGAMSGAVKDAIYDALKNDPQIAATIRPPQDGEGVSDYLKTIVAGSGVSVFGLIAALMRARKARANAEDAAQSQAEALATVTRSVASSPPEIADAIRQAVKANGGRDPAIAAAIARSLKS